MGLLSELLVFSLFLCCGEPFMFFLWKKAKEPLEKAPCGVMCGKHTRVRLNYPAHAQGWLGYKWLWLLFGFAFVLYVILKFWVHSKKSKNKTKEQNPLGLRGYPLRSLRKKNQHASQDYAFTALTHLEMDLMKLVAKVRNLKAAMTPRSNLRLNNPDFPMDPQNCAVLYDIWGENPE